MERNYDLEKRKYVIGGAVIVIVLIFLIRLLSLQIMSEDYKKNADSNAFLKKIQYPSRGVIYDRNDKLLVYNQAAYDITVIMKEITELDTMDLCQTLKISPEFLRKKFRDMKNRRLNPGYSPYTNQVFLTQLSAEDCGVFQEKLFKFPGFYIQRRTIRQYTYNAGAHILKVTYLMTVIQFCGRPSTLPLTNQLQPSTSKTDKKLLRFFKKFWNIKKASASTLETEVIFQYTKSVVNAKTAAPDYSDATVKLLQMCDFWGILPTSTRIGIRLAHVGIQPGFSVS